MNVATLEKIVSEMTPPQPVESFFLKKTFCGKGFSFWDSVTPMLANNWYLPNTSRGGGKPVNNVKEQFYKILEQDNFDPQNEEVKSQRASE